MSPGAAAPRLQVRDATAADIPALLDLMRGLARYERYAPDFRVTEAVLLAQGFGAGAPDFEALVAEAEGGVLGMAVHYMVPFTYRARPTLYLKELYVAEAGRNRGAGAALLTALARRARERGCALVKWQVARWNSDAMRFYERFGARPDDGWVDYQLDADGIAALAGGGARGRAPAAGD